VKEREKFEGSAADGRVPSASAMLRLEAKPLGLLSVAAYLVCLSTVLGHLGGFSWFLDLFSHFRVQYAIFLALASAILAFRKRRKTALILLPFLLANSFQVLPLYFANRKAVENNNSMTYKIVLVNVNAHKGDPETVGRFIAKSDPDILVLEELSSRWLPMLACLEKSHPHRVLCVREDNFGIGLFSKHDFLDANTIEIGDGGVPSIDALISLPDTPIHVVATHPLPPVSAEYSRARNEQIERIPDFLDASIPSILVGDLNSTPWNCHFKKLLKDSKFLDSSKGFGVQPTWPTSNPLLWIPLDHCLHSQSVSIIGRSRGPHVGSDHYPLTVEFKVAMPR
jgi:endonuclease/exonuclease/phosphatase (EEP) superfamily protein YafD